MPVTALVGFEPSALGGGADGDQAELGVDEGRDGNELRGAGHVGDDEAVQIVDHPAGEDFAEGSDVALVCLLHGPQVSGSLFLEDHHRRVAEPDEHEVQREPAGAAVAVDERVDACEVVMCLG